MKYLISIILSLVLVSVLRAQNLIACYNFDNGQAIEQIGGSSGTVSLCNPSSDRFGNANRAIHIDCRTGGSINLGHRPNLKPREGTIAMWVKVRSGCIGGSSNPFINCPNYTDTLRPSSGRSNIKSSYQIVQLYGDNVLFSNIDFNVIYTFNQNIMNFGTWYHVVLTFSDTLGVLYLNGQEGARNSKTPNSYMYNQDVIMGYEPIEYGSLDGDVDDLQFYDAPLSAAQVAALYTSTANCSMVGIPGVTDEQRSLKLIPNPNGGQFSVEQPEGLALVSYRLYDMAGRVLYSADGLSSISTLNFEGLANGTYLLELKDETGTAYRQKLLVTK